MAMSEPDSKSIDDPKEALLFQHPHMEEMLTLANLAGIKGPGNTMKIITELVGMNVPPTEIHRLLRDVLAKKAHSNRVSTKQHSSRHPPTPSEHVQENTFSTTSSS